VTRGARRGGHAAFLVPHTDRAGGGQDARAAATLGASHRRTLRVSC